MYRLLASTFTWLVLVLGIAQAVPSRPLYEPEEPSKPSLSIELRGTTWFGKLFMEGEQVTFNADGSLTYGHADSTSPGSWRLTGNQLYFEINKYSEYQTVVEGDIIKGMGWNKGGQKSQPLLKRISNQGHNAPPVRR